MDNTALEKIASLIESHAFNQALTELDQFLESRPLHLQALKHKTQCIAKIESPQHALTFFKHYQNHFDNKPPYYQFLLKLALDAIDKDTAENICELILEQFPNNLNLAYQAAQGLMRTGNHSKAEQVHLTILKQSEFKRIACYSPLALIAMQNQDYAQALSYNSKAKPSLTQLDYYLLCFMHRNQWQDATVIIEQLKSLRQQLADQPDKSVFSFFEFFWHEYQKQPELIEHIKTLKSINLKTLCTLWKTFPKAILLSNLLLIMLRKNGLIEKNNQHLLDTATAIPKHIWQY